MQEVEALHDATARWLAAHAKAPCPDEGSPCAGQHLRSWSLASHDGAIRYNSGNFNDETIDQVPTYSEHTLDDLSPGNAAPAQSWQAC